MTVETVRQKITGLEHKPRWMTLAIVALLSATVTLVFLTLLPDSLSANESSDFLIYRPAALNLLAGNGYTFNGSTPLLRFPPGYSIILAGLISLSNNLSLPEPFVLRWFNILCLAGSAIMLFKLTEDVWGYWSGWFVALLWMTYPFALWTAKQPNSELPFFFIFFFIIYQFWRLLIEPAPRFSAALGGRYFLMGLLMGAGMLIRPIAIGLTVVLAATMWLAQMQWPLKLKIFVSACLFAGNLIALAPWQIWVYSQTQQVVVLSTATAAALRDGVTFAVKSKGFRQGIEVPDNVLALMQRIDESYAELTSTGAVITVLKDELINDPVALTHLYGIKAARTWYGTDSQRFEGAIKLIQAVYLLPIAIGMWFSWKLRDKTRMLTIMILLLTLYFWFMNILSTTLLRYMVPQIGLLLCCMPAIIFYFRRRNIDTLKVT